MCCFKHLVGNPLAQSLFQLGRSSGSHACGKQTHWVLPKGCGTAPSRLQSLLSRICCGLVCLVNNLLCQFTCLEQEVQNDRLRQLCTSQNHQPTNDEGHHNNIRKIIHFISCHSLMSSFVHSFRFAAMCTRYQYFSNKSCRIHIHSGCSFVHFISLHCVRCFI